MGVAHATPCMVSVQRCHFAVGVLSWEAGPVTAESCYWVCCFMELYGETTISMFCDVNSCDTSMHVILQGTDHTVEIIAAILLPVAIIMCVYALTVFIWRAKAISKKQVSLFTDFAFSLFTGCQTEPSAG